VKDALCAFLHARRVTILDWANRLANAQPLNGIVTNMVESPIPRTLTNIVSRGPEWWGDAFGARKAAGTEESTIVGLSITINYTGALTMQTETPIEY
jgi:hypothetical protein